MVKLNDIFLNLYFEVNKPKKYAGFLLRLFAFIIDFIILSIIGAILVYTFNLSPKVRFQITDFLAIVSHPVFLLSGWIYYSFLESNPKYQATFGKRLFKLKVVDINEKKISFLRATGRYYAKIISAIILGIGFFMIAFTKYRQGLHDIAAGTFVIIKYE